MVIVKFKTQSQFVYVKKGMLDHDVKLKTLVIICRVVQTEHAFQLLQIKTPEIILMNKLIDIVNVIVVLQVVAVNTRPQNLVLHHLV
jgi:hypothetical protein